MFHADIRGKTFLEFKNLWPHDELPVLEHVIDIRFNRLL